MLIGNDGILQVYHLFDSGELPDECHRRSNRSSRIESIAAEMGIELLRATTGFDDMDRRMAKQSGACRYLRIDARRSRKRS